MTSLLLLLETFNSFNFTSCFINSRLDIRENMSSPRPSKRQRIRRACAPCRRRKSKCDGQQPECTICRSAGRFCSYEDSGRRRGLQSGYVRSLEAVLGLVLQHVPRSEETVRRILRNRQRQGHLTNDAVDDCATLWRESKMARDASSFLMPSSKGDERDHEADDGHEWEVTPLEAMDELEEAMGPDKELEYSEPISTIPNCFPQTSFVAATEKTDFLDRPFPENTADLLDTYFTHIHSWFPVLERCDLLRVMHTTGHHNNSSYTDTGVRLTIWAIVAYVSANQRDSHSQQDPSPAQIQDCIQLRTVADSNVHDLGHIQALVILSLLYIGQGKLDRAWILIAHVTRMVAMLHASARTHRYKHTFHACIILDNLVSALLDKTPCLSLHEQAEHGPVGENGLEEWDMWTVLPALGPKSPLRALSAFNTIHQLMLELTRVLHSRLNEGYTHDIFGDIDRWREKLVSSHPYKKDCPNPPLLILHLSWAFAMSSSILKSSPMDSRIASLGINTVRSTLEMLDNYIQTTKTSDYFPLLPVFALQAQRCLQLSRVSASCKDLDILGSRLEAHLGTLKENLGGISLGSSTVPADATQYDTYMSNASENGERVDEPLAFSTHQAPLDLPSTATFPDACTVPNQPTGQGETADLDLFFEEMVASISTTR